MLTDIANLEGKYGFSHGNHLWYKWWMGKFGIFMIIVSGKFSDPDKKEMNYILIKVIIQRNTKPVFEENVQENMG